MPLTLVAKQVRKLASDKVFALRALLNGRGLAKFKRLYALKGELGHGGFGIVYSRMTKDHTSSICTSGAFVWRMVSQLNDERVPMEICMLARCQKVKGVIGLLDWFSTPEGFLIVMERPSPCIDLFDFIHSQQRLNEDLARFIYRQIVLTLVSCTERKVLHRDIKDENVVIDLVNGKAKLIDFGAATYMRGSSRYQDFQGTRLYCPPEWFLHELYLGIPATVWSLGILLYNMLNGHLPFKNDKEICSSQHHELPFVTGCSEGARSLVKACLKFDPFARPSLRSILEHFWLEARSRTWTELSMDAGIQATLSEFVCDPVESDKLQSIRVAKRVLSEWRTEVSTDDSATSSGNQAKARCVGVTPPGQNSQDSEKMDKRPESKEIPDAGEEVTIPSGLQWLRARHWLTKVATNANSFDSGLASMYASPQVSPQSNKGMFFD